MELLVQYTSPYGSVWYLEDSPPLFSYAQFNIIIQFIVINHCIKNLCANLLVSKKDLVVRSDSQRSEPYRFIQF